VGSSDVVKGGREGVAHQCYLEKIEQEPKYQHIQYIYSTSVLSICFMVQQRQQSEHDYRYLSRWKGETAKLGASYPR